MKFNGFPNLETLGNELLFCCAVGAWGAGTRGAGTRGEGRGGCPTLK